MLDIFCHNMQNEIGISVIKMTDKKEENGERVVNTYIMYGIVCLCVLLAGFVDSIAGGGGLISLPAYMIAGLPAHTAIATNKMSSSMGTAIASWHYFRQGFMKWKLCIPSVLAAIVGSWLGARLTLLIPDRALKIAMLVVLPVILFYVTRSKTLSGDAQNEEEVINGSLIFKCVLIALGIGVYDGVYGPGTGTFLMLLFTGFCHLTMNDAAGTTKAINLTTNITALTVFLINGKVLLGLGIAAGVCNMIGNFLGSHCFTDKGTKIVKPIMIVVIVIFFIKVVSELIG